MGRLPLSGSEVVYSDLPWVKIGPLYNNCYAYAVNDFETYRSRKSIPGDVSGMSKLFHTYTHCKGLIDRVISDNPKKVYRCKPTVRCRRGYYKIMMAVAPKNKYGSPTGDFHFYKQHGAVKYKVKRGDTYRSIADFFNVPIGRIYRAGPIKTGKVIKFKANIFSHKRGWGTGPLLTDACGKAIIDPRTSCRDYGYKYEKMCGSMCVKNKGIDVGPDVRKKGSKVLNVLQTYLNQR